MNADDLFINYLFNRTSLTWIINLILFFNVNNKYLVLPTLVLRSVYCISKYNHEKQEPQSSHDCQLLNFRWALFAEMTQFNYIPTFDGILVGTNIKITAIYNVAHCCVSTICHKTQDQIIQFCCMNQKWIWCWNVSRNRYTLYSRDVINLHRNCKIYCRINEIEHWTKQCHFVLIVFQECRGKRL